MGMPGIVNSRRVRPLVWFYDVTLAAISMYVGLVLRLGNLQSLDAQAVIGGALLPFAAATGIAHLLMRTHRTSWRHASTSDLTNILYTVSLAVLIYLPLSFVTTRLGSIPRTSVVMAWLVLFFLMAG